VATVLRFAHTLASFSDRCTGSYRKGVDELLDSLPHGILKDNRIAATKR
jgi:hypothetical protein